MDSLYTENYRPIALSVNKENAENSGAGATVPLCNTPSEASCLWGLSEHQHLLGGSRLMRFLMRVKRVCQVLGWQAVLHLGPANEASDMLAGLTRLAGTTAI